MTGVAGGADGLPAGFGYYGHSTSFPVSVGTHCLDGDGDGRFDRMLQVSSEPVGFPDVNRDGMRTSLELSNDLACEADVGEGG